MTTQQPARFSWNLGGLLGSAVGSSSWIALTPFIADWHTAGILIALGCAALILLAVPILWNLRMKIEPLQGILILLTVAFVSTFLFLLSAHIMRLPLLASWQPTKLADASNFFWILLFFPLLALIFWLIGRPKRTNSEQGGAGAESDIQSSL